MALTQSALETHRTTTAGGEAYVQVKAIFDDDCDVGNAVNLLVVVDTIHAPQQVSLKRGGTTRKCDVIVCDDTAEGRYLTLAFWGRAMCRWTDSGVMGHLRAGDVVWITRVKLNVFMGTVCGSVGGRCSIVKLSDGRVPRGAGVTASDARVAELVAWRDARRRTREGVIGVAAKRLAPPAASDTAAEAVASAEGAAAGTSAAATSSAVATSTGTRAASHGGAPRRRYARLSDLDRHPAGTRVHVIARIERVVLPDASGNAGSATLSDGPNASILLRLPLESVLGAHAEASKKAKRKLRKLAARQRAAYEQLRNMHEGKTVEILNVGVEHVPELHLLLVNGVTTIRSDDHREARDWRHM